MLTGTSFEKLPTRKSLMGNCNVPMAVSTPFCTKLTLNEAKPPGLNTLIYPFAI